MTLFRPLVPVRVLAFLALILTATVCSANTRVWLLVNPELTDGVLTGDAHEREVLQKAGWKLDGTASVRSGDEADSGELHRLYRQGGGRKLEADGAQLKTWVDQGFADEGVLGKVATKPGSGRLPVYHLTKSDSDLWVMNPSTRDAAVKAGWKLEPTTIWLWRATADSATPEARP